VELPADLSSDTLDRLTGTRISGRLIELRPDTGGPRRRDDRGDRGGRPRRDTRDARPRWEDRDSGDRDSGDRGEGADASDRGDDAPARKPRHKTAGATTTD
jgi:ATP-dependent RNA helicase DeaD